MHPTYGLLEDRVNILSAYGITNRRDLHLKNLLPSSQWECPCTWFESSLSIHSTTVYIANLRINLIKKLSKHNKSQTNCKQKYAHISTIHGLLDYAREHPFYSSVCQTQTMWLWICSKYLKLNEKPIILQVHVYSFLFYCFLLALATATVFCLLFRCLSSSQSANCNEIGERRWRNLPAYGLSTGYALVQWRTIVVLRTKYKHSQYAKKLIRNVVIHLISWCYASSSDIHTCYDSVSILDFRCFLFALSKMVNIHLIVVI